MICPQCKLINPEGTEACDCGYKVSDRMTGTVRTEVRYWNDGLPEIVGGSQLALLAGWMLLLEVMQSSAWTWILGPIMLVLSFTGGNALVRKLRTKLTFPRTGYVELPEPASFSRFFKPLVWPEPEQARPGRKRLILRILWLLVAVGFIAIGGAVVAAKALAKLFGPGMSLVMAVAFLIAYLKGNQALYIWSSITSLVIGIALMRWDGGVNGLWYPFLGFALVAILVGGLRLLNFLRRHPAALREHP